MSVRRRRLRSIVAFGGGLLLALALPLTAGELYLRAFPPEDFRPYLGEASPLTGPFRPDEAFGVQYRSWDAFKKDHEGRIWPYLPYIEGSWKPPTWAMFGNSFVQAAGMLADTARVRVPQRMIFNLGRNEPLAVRLAQVQLLLENGLRPERIFVALLPLDLVALGQHRLADVHVTAAGALTYRPRNPGGALGWAIGHSRLALTGWVRSKRHYANPAFRPGDLVSRIDPLILSDVEHLFRSLATTTQRFGVPVTVVLIPNYEQITRGAPFGFQDALGPMLERIGFDVVDPRQLFVEYPDKKALFIPDKHFSTLGNQLLLDEILRHLRTLGADPTTSLAGGVGS